eukprot:UN04761
MDTLNFTTTIKLQNPIAIIKFVRKKSALFIIKFLFEFKFFQFASIVSAISVT